MMATLLELRQQLRRPPYGRVDLVNSDGSDNGANWFIQAAQRTLDRMQPTPLRIMGTDQTLSAGSWTLLLPGAFAFVSVWYEDDDGELVQLELISLQEMLEKYPALGDSDPGDPVYWAVDAHVGEVLDLSDASTTKRIIIMPPLDVQRTFKIYYQVESTKLENDSDESYWSIAHPDVLLLATVREIAIASNDEQRAESLLREINRRLIDIDREIVEQEMAYSMQMEG